MHNLSAKVNDSALPWYSPLLTLLGSLRKSSKAIIVMHWTYYSNDQLINTGLQDCHWAQLIWASLFPTLISYSSPYIYIFFPFSNSSFAVPSLQHGSCKPCNIIFAFTTWLLGYLVTLAFPKCPPRCLTRKLRLSHEPSFEF